MNQCHKLKCCRTTTGGFTLLELLVVVGIIALLISILMPSLGRAREQARATHCLARLKEFGNGLVTYANETFDALPPALWDARLVDEPQTDDPPAGETPAAERFEYGWSEILWSYVYREEVYEPDDFPVQRNVDARKWDKYMLCATSKQRGENSGHYRVYLPSWSYGTYHAPRRSRWVLEEQNRLNYPDPRAPASYSEIRPKLPLVGDANDRSYRGDGLDDDDTSWIDAAEANEGGTDGNRFSDRHYGYTNFLFADMHADKDAELREILARDWDLNGVDDIEAPEPPP